MVWKYIDINKNHIKCEGKRSVLFCMPHNSEFDGYVFWHPLKCVRPADHSNQIRISFTDEFVFHVKMYGKGKHNKKEVIDSLDLCPSDIIEAFLSDENSDDPLIIKPLLHTPAHLDPVHIEAIEELIDE